MSVEGGCYGEVVAFGAPVYPGFEDGSEDCVGELVNELEGELVDFDFDLIDLVVGVAFFIAVGELYSSKVENL